MTRLMGSGSFRTSGQQAFVVLDPLALLLSRRLGAVDRLPMFGFAHIEPHGLMAVRTPDFRAGEHAPGSYAKILIAIRAEKRGVWKGGHLSETSSVVRLTSNCHGTVKIRGLTRK